MDISVQPFSSKDVSLVDSNINQEVAYPLLPGTVYTYAVLFRGASIGPFSLTTPAAQALPFEWTDTCVFSVSDLTNPSVFLAAATIKIKCKYQNQFHLVYSSDASPDIQTDDYLPQFLSDYGYYSTAITLTDLVPNQCYKYTMFHPGGTFGPFGSTTAKPTIAPATFAVSIVGMNNWGILPDAYTCLNSNWCQPCFTDALLDSYFKELALFGKTGPSRALIFENVPQGVVDFLITVDTFSDGTVHHNWVLYGLPDPGNLTLLEASKTFGIQNNLITCLHAPLGLDTKCTTW